MSRIWNFFSRSLDERNRWMIFPLVNLAPNHKIKGKNMREHKFRAWEGKTMANIVLKYPCWRIRDNGKTYWTHTIKQCDRNPGKRLWDKILAWWFQRSK